MTFLTFWTRCLLLYPMLFSWYLSKLFLSIFKFLRINGNVVSLQKPRPSSELHKLFSVFISVFETCMGSTCLEIKNLHIYPQHPLILKTRKYDQEDYFLKSNGTLCLQGKLIVTKSTLLSGLRKLNIYAHKWRNLRSSYFSVCKGERRHKCVCKKRSGILLHPIVARFSI